MRKDICGENMKKEDESRENEGTKNIEADSIKNDTRDRKRTIITRAKQ
jgi:hypothetical protein